MPSEKPESIAQTPNVPTAVFVIAILGFIVRLALCMQPACASRDGVHFVGYAKKLAADPVKWMRIETKQPGFAFLLLASRRLLGGLFGGESPEAWQRCGELLALLGGVAACLCVYVLTRRLFNERMAAAAGILTCFWPQGAQLSADVLSDMPHLALYLAALLVAYRALMQHAVWRFAVCGFLIGLAYMFRQEAIGLLAAVVLCIFWFWADRAPKAGNRIKALTALLVPFAAVAAPHSIACGELMPNKGPQDILGRLPDSERPPVTFAARSPPEVYLSPEANPPHSPSCILHSAFSSWQAPFRMAEYWAKSGRYVFSTLFLIALFVKSVPRAEKTGKRLLFCAVLVHLLLVQLRATEFGEISSRYLVIPAALCLPWAAAALDTILREIVARLRSPATARVASVWIAGWLVTLALPAYYLTRPLDDGQEPYRTAGQWLREHAKAEDKVLAHERLDQIMFYAGRTWPDDDKWLKLKQTDGLDAIRRAIRRKSPAWLVDSTGSRRAKIDEKAHFEALLQGDIPAIVLRRAVSGSARRVYVWSTEARAETEKSVPEVRAGGS